MVADDQARGDVDAVALFLASAGTISCERAENLLRCRFSDLTFTTKAGERLVLSGWAHVSGSP